MQTTPYIYPSMGAPTLRRPFRLPSTNAQSRLPANALRRGISFRVWAPGANRVVFEVSSTDPTGAHLQSVTARGRGGVFSAGLTPRGNAHSVRATAYRGSRIIGVSQARIHPSTPVVILPSINGIGMGKTSGGSRGGWLGDVMDFAREGRETYGAISGEDRRRAQAEARAAEARAREAEARAEMERARTSGGGISAGDVALYGGIGLAAVAAIYLITRDKDEV